MTAPQPSAARPEDGTDELRTVAVLHYVLAALTALSSLLGIPLIPLGWMLLDSARHSTSYGSTSELADPVLWGATLLATGVTVLTLGMAHAWVLWYIGRSIAQRRRRGLSIVVSIFNLTYVPLGTAVSAYALVVLFRAKTRDMFR